MPAYGFKIEVIFIFRARAISLPGQCRYWLCTLAFYVRARAHWQNIVQRDVIVVVVLVVLDELLRF